MTLPGSYFQPVVLPRPVHVESGEGVFSFTLSEMAIVADEQTLAIGRMFAETLGGEGRAALPVLTEPQPGKAIITLKIDSELAHLGTEGYTLTITAAQAVLRAASPAGVFYATRTFLQLLSPDFFSASPDEKANRGAWTIPSVSIEDSPRFSWRGCMLDTSRHFIPKSELFKLVDVLALHKMNRLHLHLTDDQGWRIEIKKYPKLTEVGSRRQETLVGHAFDPRGYDGTPHGGFYTQEDLRELVAYARERFITLVPEIELPGHAQAAIAAYPEFGTLNEPVEVATIWGIHPYLYNPSEQTFQFLQDVLTEVMDIFPGPFIHVGGDEAIKNQWQASPHVQALIKQLGLKDEDELQSWFVSRIGTFLEQHGRRLVGWDEILEGGLPAGATVMSWRGTEGGIAAAQMNHDVIMTPQSHVYFDHYQQAEQGEPLAIGGYTPLEKVYSYDPVPDVLTPEQGQRVLGVQCNLWTEYIPTTEHLEYMLFPRAVALAEIAWTPREQLNYADFRQRLLAHEDRLRGLNINFRPLER